MTTTDFTSHDHIVDQLAEYSLGILDGRGQSVVERHLARCASCSTALINYNSTVESLLRLSRDAEPPEGFESRTMERIRFARRTSDRGMWVKVVAVAALVAVVFFGLGSTLNYLNSRPPTSLAAAVEERALVSHGRVVGTVDVNTGHPRWMLVTVVDARAPKLVHCTLVLSSGHRSDLGTFELAQGWGKWGVPISVNFRSIRNVVLTSSTGQLVAQFSTHRWIPSRSKENLSW